MRGIGIITLLSVGAIAVAPGPPKQEPLLEVAGNPTVTFANCLSRPSLGVARTKNGNAMTDVELGTTQNGGFGGGVTSRPEIKEIDQCL